MLMLQMNHHSKLTCLCISHWIRLTKRHVSECLCNYFSHLYVRFGHSGRFGQRICSERSQLSADESCWAFQEPTHMLPFHTSYLSISHTAVVLCVCVWCDGMRISQGRVTKREERDERKAKRWEEKRAIMQMWLNDVAVPRATVISSALSFIYYHTTAETVYILIDCKSQHTFTLIMAMTFNIGHPCQARCFADIQKLSLMDWVSHHKGN